MLSIGILTHNSPITLENSFKSYKLSGLFDFTDDIFCLIQPSEKSEDEILICNNYSIRYINSTLTIIPASLLVIANNVTKIYDRIPYFGGADVIYDGFMANDTPQNLIGTLKYIKLRAGLVL